MSKIPFVDLYAQYCSIKDEVDLAIKNVIEKSAYIGGDVVKQFEKDFATYLGVEQVVSCANGTDSIEIILQTLGIGAGDEVIVPAVSWISTSEAVSTCGAKPVFVDVDEKTWTIDPNLIEAKITAHTRAIIPVHLYGQPADMAAILQIGKKYRLAIVEDCAQAHGAVIDGKKTGTFGIAASFSFYPGKNLGAYGDAGAMTMNDAQLAEKCRMIANHGQLTKHQHLMEGRNSRLDGLQAAILSVKLKHLDAWTKQRQILAEHYKKHLAQMPDINIQQGVLNSHHVYHLFVVRSKKRAELIRKLDANNIAWAIHYPKALPFLEAYKHMNHQPNDFPVAHLLTDEIISLPMFPELNADLIPEIVAVLNQV